MQTHIADAVRYAHSGSHQASRDLLPCTSSTFVLPSRTTLKPLLSIPVGQLSFPAYLQAVSSILRIEGRHAQALLDKNPFLRAIDVAQLQERLDSLVALTGLSSKQVAFMVTKQPQYLLLTSLEAIEQSIQQLASALGVEPSSVVRWSSTTPSILKRSSDILHSRVSQLSDLWRTSTQQTLAIVQQEPEYITDSLPSIDKRSTAIRHILMISRSTLARMLQRQPDVLFMSPRIMNNKLKVLMSILNKDRKAVGVIIAKAPKLLRCNLTAVRSNFQQLQELLGRQESYVYAMACHHPRLLLERPDALKQHVQRLKTCVSSSDSWAQEWQQLRPAQTEECLARSSSRVDRLDFLLSAGSAASHRLEEALCLPSAAFSQQHLEFAQYQRSRVCKGAGKDSSSKAVSSKLANSRARSKAKRQAGRAPAHAAAAAAAVPDSSSRSHVAAGVEGVAQPLPAASGAVAAARAVPLGIAGTSAVQQAVRPSNEAHSHGSSSNSSSSSSHVAAAATSSNGSSRASSSSRDSSREDLAGPARSLTRRQLEQQQLEHHLASVIAGHSLFADANSSACSGSSDSRSPGTSSRNGRHLAGSSAAGSLHHQEMLEAGSSGHSSELHPVQHLPLPVAHEQQLTGLVLPAGSAGNGSSRARQRGGSRRAQQQEQQQEAQQHELQLATVADR
jgi:hypothetical protein